MFYDDLLEYYNIFHNNIEKHLRLKALNLEVIISNNKYFYSFNNNHKHILS
jgi:hypothetical protein